MSRHQLAPLDADDHPDREVVVGYNPGMQTLFAHVIDGIDDYGMDAMTVDIGSARIGEVTNPDEVIDAVRDYAEIPDDLATVLAAEQRAGAIPADRLAVDGGLALRLGLIDGGPADSPDETLTLDTARRDTTSAYDALDTAEDATTSQGESLGLD